MHPNISNITSSVCVWGHGVCVPLSFHRSELLSCFDGTASSNNVHWFLPTHRPKASHAALMQIDCTVFNISFGAIIMLGALCVYIKCCLYVLSYCRNHFRVNDTNQWLSIIAAGFFSVEHHLLSFYQSSGLYFVSVIAPISHCLSVSGSCHPPHTHYI